MNTTKNPAPVERAHAADVPPQDRNLATLSHLSAFVGFVGIPPLIGPLVMWLIKRDDPYVADQAKEALNFNFSFLIYTVVAAISILVLIGLLLVPAVLITWFVLVIRAAVRTSAAGYYRYPFTLRFVN